MHRIARAAIDIIRLTFAREELGDAKLSPGGPRRVPHHFLRTVFSSEPLPEDPPAPPHRRFSFRALFAIEPLPRDPEAPPPPRHWRLTLRTLVAPEALPFDPVPPAPRRSSRLAALFAPESLDER